MKLSDLTLLDNIRSGLGDITNLLLSIDFLGVRVPVMYFVEGENKILWDGYRRLRCVQIVNHVHALRQENPDITPQQLLQEVKPFLTDCTLEWTELQRVGHNNPIPDIPAHEYIPISGTKTAIEFQLLCAANRLREPLNPLDEAKAMRKLQDVHGYTQARLAQILGVSEGYVSRRIRLPDLHPDFQEAVAKGTLAPRAAEQLLSLSDTPDAMSRKALIGAKSYRSVGRLVEAIKAAGAAPTVEHEDAIEDDDMDLLMLVYRRECALKMEAARAALTELLKVYRMVDVPPTPQDLFELAADMGDIYEDYIMRMEEESKGGDYVFPTQ